MAQITDLSEVLEEKIIITKGVEHQKDFIITVENAQKLERLLKNRDKVIIGSKDHEAIIRGLNIKEPADSNGNVGVQIFLLGV